jgi:anaerobic ribonucleoside-triphosphate reductase
MPKRKVTRQRCEVYSRVVGYLSPVGQWNVGKKTEWVERKVFCVNS